MNKLKMLALLPSLCLASCSQSSYYGVYEFRLGKTDGAHFGLSIELKDEANEKHEGYQNLKLTADLGSEISLDQMIDDYSEENIILKELLSQLLKIIPEDHSIDGYYNVTEYKNDKYGNRVKLGSDFISNLLEEKFPTLTEFLKPFGDITTPENIEKVLCSYVNNSQFTLQIPVSLEDLQYQLAWYGYLVDPNGERFFTKLDAKKLPGPEGEERIGVHPSITKNEKGDVVDDESITMNENFEFEFSHTYLYEENESGSKIVAGSFLTRKNDNDQKVLYFKMFDETRSVQEVNGFVKISTLFSEEYKPIKFSAAPQSKEVTVTSNGKTDIQEGFFDMNGNEFYFDQLMKKPFIFRDFHDVKLGLTRAD